MSSGIASLHKILKDETRRKIILLINEKDSLTYTELLEDTKAGSTGLLNYHLKILGDLLNKNQTGQYQLSEKGKLAFKLIVEFPEENNQAQKRKGQRLLLVTLGIGQIIYLSVILVFYFIGQLEFYRVVTGISAFVIGMIVLYFIYRMQRTIPAPGSSQEAGRIKIGYVAGGVSFSLLIAFFGVGVLFHVISGLSGRRFSMGNPLYETLWSPGYMIFSMLIAPAIGGALAYYWGKSNGFKKPKWAVWLDSHL